MAFASLADELAGAMDSGDGPGSSLADEFGLDDLGLDEVNGLRASSPYTTPQQPLHPLPGNTPSPQLPPSATSKLARNTNTRNGLNLPLPRPSPSISPAQTRTGKSSTSSYHTAQSSAHAELDEAFDLSMEMGTGLGLGLGLAGELGPVGQIPHGSEKWNEYEHGTANGLPPGSEHGFGFTDGHEDGDREDVALESRLGDDLAGRMDGEYPSHGGQVGPSGPSWMTPKIEKDPIVILQDCLAVSSRLLASLRSTDEEPGPRGSLELPRPIHTVVGQRGSDSTSAGQAWDVEDALRAHLHKLHDAERVREEQMREIVAMGREWAGINWAQGEWMPGWWERERQRQRQRLEKGEVEGERVDDVDDVGWIGDPQASVTTVITADDPKGNGDGRPETSAAKTVRRLSLEDHALEDTDTRGGRGRESSTRDEAEKDPHAALDELLSPADELDELLLAPSVTPPQSSHPTLHRDQHQTQHRTQHQHPRPSSPYPSPALAPETPLGLNLPNQVHQLITDTPSPALHHLSESLHTATSHATSLSRTIRGIRAGIEHYRERDTLEEDARRGIEQWEARRVERGLRGEGGVRAVLYTELEGFRGAVDDWGRRMGEVKREAVVV